MGINANLHLGEGLLVVPGLLSSQPDGASAVKQAEALIEELVRTGFEIWDKSQDSFELIIFDGMDDDPWYFFPTGKSLLPRTWDRQPPAFFGGRQTDEQGMVDKIPTSALLLDPDTVFDGMLVEKQETNPFRSQKQDDHRETREEFLAAYSRCHLSNSNPPLQQRREHVARILEALRGPLAAATVHGKWLLTYYD